MLYLTQKQLEVLEKVANHVSTEEKPYFTTNNTNKAVQALKALGLVETRAKGITVEVAITELGDGVVKATVEHEIVGEEELGEMPKAETAPTFEFVLEDDVPMPKLTRSSSKPVPYPLAQMNVGQSFFIPAVSVDVNLAKYRSNISSKVSQYKRKLGLESTFTVLADLERNGVRVWRKA